MNMHEPAGYRNFPLLGWTGFLRSPWKGVIDTISSSFRKEPAIGKLPIVDDNPTIGWLLNESEQPEEEWIEKIDPTAGKSVEELRSLRKEMVSTIWKNHSDLSETIYRIARVAEEHAPDSKIKVAALDTQFNYLMSELEKNEETLADYNRAISKFFSRRRTDGQSVHI